MKADGPSVGPSLLTRLCFLQMSNLCQEYLVLKQVWRGAVCTWVQWDAGDWTRGILEIAVFKLIHVWHPLGAGGWAASGKCIGGGCTHRPGR